MTFDPNYDPYDHLQRLDDLVTQLIAANNHTQNTLLELTEQHKMLVSHLKANKQLMSRINLDIELLKNNHFKP